MEFLQLILRALQFLWTLLTTALIGNVIATNISGSAAAESSLNFVMFVDAWAWITLLYGLVAAVVSGLAIPIVMLALDGLATLFTFIAAVVLSARLTAVNCSSIADGSPDIAFGSSGDTQKRCREIQAGIVFMWLLWATFAAGLVFVFREFRSGGTSVHRGPNMSQIGV